MARLCSAWRCLALASTGETAAEPAAPANALSWERLRWLYLAAFGAIAATLLNPLGPGIFGYVLKLLTDAPSQGLVIEWQPPTTQGLAGFSFFISILALLVAFALTPPQPDLSPICCCSAHSCGWPGPASVTWSGMAWWPCRCWPKAWRHEPRAPQAASRRGRTPLPSTDDRAGAARAADRRAAAFKARLALPQPYQALFADVPGAPGLFSADTPVAATEYLRATPVDGRLFNEMGYGSYLDWALYPTTQVFVDPRVELYPLALWQDYLAVRDGRDYNALLIDKYNVERVVLDRVFTAAPGRRTGERPALGARICRHAGGDLPAQISRKYMLYSGPIPMVDDR